MIKGIVKAWRRRKTKRRAANNEKRHKAWIDTLPPPSGADAAALRLVYTDRENRNYYVFADPLNMSVERSEKIAEAVAAANFSVEKDDITAALAETMTAITAGNMKTLKAEILPKIADLRHRMDRIGVESLVLSIAVLFFITDDENPYTVNPLTTAEKRRRAMSDDDLRAFFLATIWEIYGKRRQISGAGFLRYIEEQKIVQGISAHLRRP